MSNTNPGRHTKIECPVSAGVLDDLYWGKNMSIVDIASYLYSEGLTDRKVSWGKVRAWFAELGVSVANPNQVFRRGINTKRNKYGSISKVLTGRRWSLNEEQRRRMSVIRKGKKLGSQTPEELGYPELECCVCAARFRRSPSSVRQSFRHGRKAVFFYCSQECRKGTIRFKDTIHAEATYFQSDWYVQALAKSGVDS